MSKLVASLFGMEEFTGIFMVLYKFGICILIIMVGTLLTKIVQKAIKRALKAGGRFNPGKNATISTVCSSVAKYIIYFLMLCYILSVWGIDPTSLLALGGVASVAAGLGAQTIIQDILAGVFILTEDQFGVGDVVSIDNYSGTVESVGMRTTRIRSADGNLYIIPNGQIQTVTNMSKGFNRAIVDVGISYDEDIDNVINILSTELESIYKSGKVKGMLSVPEVLGVEELAASCVILRVKADCSIGDNWDVERQLRKLIKQAFDREGIEIPYPQQVVYVQNRKEV